MVTQIDATYAIRFIRYLDDSFLLWPIFHTLNRFYLTLDKTWREGKVYSLDLCISLVNVNFLIFYVVCLFVAEEEKYSLHVLRSIQTP